MRLFAGRVHGMLVDAIRERAKENFHGMRVRVYAIGRDGEFGLDVNQRGPESVTPSLLRKGR
jgi:hypothetical protein